MSQQTASTALWSSGLYEVARCHEGWRMRSPDCFAQSCQGLAISVSGHSVPFFQNLHAYDTHALFQNIVAFTFPADGETSFLNGSPLYVYAVGGEWLKRVYISITTHYYETPGIGIVTLISDHPPYVSNFNKRIPINYNLRMDPSRYASNPSLPDLWSLTKGYTWCLDP